METVILKKKMPRIVNVISAKHIDDFVLKITFSDGCINICDFRNFLFNSKNPMITKFQNIDLFIQFEIIDGTLSWNDFEMSFNLDDLYYRKTM